MTQEELDKARAQGRAEEAFIRVMAEDSVSPEISGEVAAKLLQMLQGGAADQDGQAQDGMDANVRDITAVVTESMDLARGLIPEGQDPDAPAQVLARASWVAGFLMMNQKPSALAGAVVFLVQELQAKEAELASEKAASVRQEAERIAQIRELQAKATEAERRRRIAADAVVARDNALTAIRNLLPSGVKTGYGLDRYLS